MDPATARLDSVLKLIDREVWLVTSAANGRLGGLIATWVSAASINPERPVVLIGLAPTHFTAELVASSGRFALHLLHERQIDLVWRFALASGRDTNKFDGLAYQLSSGGAPIVSDCPAWLACRVIARYDAGDRLFFWADAEDGALSDPGMPLREKRMLELATAEQKAAIVAARNADIGVLAPLRQAWLDRLHRR
jgi:flavin reductase (DIM6/NTAB) family NADH-FMN oxidoreductase RutF